MDSLKLSAKELLVLSSRLGAQTFYGIADPFRGMTKAEIWSEIPDLQLQAEKRGLLSMGFDEEISLTGLAATLIPTCAFCERYLTVDSIFSGALQPSRRLYVRKERAVALQQDGTQIALWEETPTKFLAGLMDTVFADCADTVPATESAVVPQAVLEQARAADDEQARDILRSAGCSPELADLLALGLHQQCKYCALTAVDLTAHTLESLICIVASTGTVRLGMADGGENWQAEWITCASIRKVLDGLGCCVSDTYGGISHATV